MPLPVPKRRHIELPLAFPIEINGEEVSKLYVLHPRGAELGLMPRQRDVTWAADVHPFAAKICGITVHDFEKLEHEDYVKVIALLNEFQEETPDPKSGQTGARSSADTSTSRAPTSSS